ncbi:unnamed protein product [Periconia digitata]|uniref:Heterokaryon incompatibility domain-containing protein n=1 Tax=Periconia digitata TaxID=1303443 RepID=A0A9W4U9K4_9PLEO|nr:unnamed protein product [Periconia digitata]
MIGGHSIQTLCELEKHLQKKVEGVPPFKPHTCQHCEKIVVEMPDRPPHFYDDPPGKSIQVSIQGVTANTLIDGANDGCPLFTPVAKDMPDKVAQRMGDLDVKLKIDLIRGERRWNSVTGKLLDGYHGTLLVEGMASPMYSLGRGVNSDCPGWLRKMWVVSPSSEGMLSWARYWYQECDKKAGFRHHMCQPAAERSSFIPTRLIVVPRKHEKQLKIVKKGKIKKEHVKWCSLSYCWGESQDMQSTTKNFRWGERTICLRELPRTILDALLVAHSIEVEYIWIDSLCILQNDPMDVQKELASMAKVYQDAAVTLVAASASKVTEGFLNPRNFEKNWESAPIQLKCRYESKQGSIMLHHLNKQAPDDPIHSRGWTLQEMMVSPRLLIYGSSATTWSCNTERYHDCDLLYPQSDDIRELSWGAVRLDGWKNNWDVIVEQYSKRKLFLAKDRLKALAAIAETYRHGHEVKKQRMIELDRESGPTKTDVSPPVKYAAGLWTDTLDEMLLWHYTEHTGNVRQGSYRAPSWSWASVDSAHAINFKQATVLSIKSITVEPEDWRLPFADAKEGSAIIRIECDLGSFYLGRDSPEDGRASEPYLASIFETYSRKKGMRKEKKTWKPKKPGEYMYLDAPKSDFVYWNTGCWSKVYMLRAYTDWKEEEYVSALLLVKTTSTGNTYKRIGICRIQDTRGKVREHFWLSDSCIIEIV